MGRHSFNLGGGEFLTTMGASWFVAYSYWLRIDKKIRNWEKVSTQKSRISVFSRSAEYHEYWLRGILLMDNNRLSQNSIGLDAATIKEMAEKVLCHLSGNE